MGRGTRIAFSVFIILVVGSTACYLTLFQYGGTSPQNKSLFEVTDSSRHIRISDDLSRNQSKNDIPKDYNVKESAKVTPAGLESIQQGVGGSDKERTENPEENGSKNVTHIPENVENIGVESDVIQGNQSDKPRSRFVILCMVCFREGDEVCSDGGLRHTSEMSRRRLMTGNIKGVPDFARDSIQSKRQYAAMHGYDFRIASKEVYVEDRGASWSKIPALQHYLQTWEWVVYMDLDTIIMNAEKKLEHIVQDGKSLLIAKDWNGINAGVLMMRNSDWSLSFLQHVWDIGNKIDVHHPWAEQLGMMTLLDSLPRQEIKTNIAYIPQKDFNAYPPNTPGIDRWRASSMWTEGDFLIHFAGCGDQAGRNCQKEFDHYFPLRKGYKEVVR